jgi:hypothetical protein
LRHVTADFFPGPDRRHKPNAGEAGMRVAFWSADWSPWRALVRIAAAFPALRFDLRPCYDTP